MTKLPAEVFQAIAQFLAANKTGQIVLNVNCGELKTWSVTETFRSESRKWVDSRGAVGILSQDRQ